jgi:hypothetical protein
MKTVLVLSVERSTRKMPYNSDYPKCPDHPNQTLYPSKFAEGHWWHYIDRAKSKETCEWIYNGDQLVRFVKPSPQAVPAQKPQEGGKTPQIQPSNDVSARLDGIEATHQRILKGLALILEKIGEEINPDEIPERVGKK